MPAKSAERKAFKDMNSIDEDLKTGNFARIYLLTGEEAYLRLQYRNKLKERLCVSGDTLNVVTYSGKDVPVNEVIDFANTIPFMAERRLVFLENTTLFESSNDALADYMKEVPEDTCIIFVQEKVDKRGRLYKAVQKYGRVVLLENPGDDILQKWLLGKIKAAGLSIRKSAMDRFMQQTSKDMQSMNAEMEKLISYCLDKGEINSEDVSAICSVKVEDRVFDMIEDIIMKNRTEALSKYYDLLTLREPPVKILSLIGQQFCRMHTAGYLKKEGLSVDEMSERMKVRPYAVKRYIINGSRYNETELLDILRECAVYENNVKSGRMSDTLSVELLIARLTDPEQTVKSAG